MKQKIDWIEKRLTLRREADTMLSSVSPALAAGKPMDVLLHELLVHKVELEMQVEELKRAHTEMEAARDHYAEFYEFAPVGYFAISRDGAISAVNLTGSVLLGVDRAALINRRLADFISEKDRDRWNSLIPSLLDAAEIERTVFMLKMLRADGTSFNAYFDCRSREYMPEAPVLPPVLSFALFDVSKIMQAEMQMRQIRELRKAEASVQG
jgi:PAS domain S-box-containing protein